MNIIQDLIEYNITGDETKGELLILLVYMQEALQDMVRDEINNQLGVN